MPRKIIPKGLSRVKEENPLAPKDQEYLDNLSSKKVLHKMKRKKMSLAESIKYESDCHRTGLAHMPYFLTKKEEDSYVKQLMKHAKKVLELINEPVSEDISLSITDPETGKKYPSGRLLQKGIFAKTVINLNKNLENLLYELPRGRSITRIRQKVQALGRCTLLKNVEDLFDQYGLEVKRHEYGEDRSDLYQCVFLALDHAGDRTSSIRNIDRDCQEHKDPAQ